MDDIELETRSMVDEGAELKHGVTCLRSRPIENSLLSGGGGHDEIKDRLPLLVH